VVRTRLRKLGKGVRQYLEPRPVPEPFQLSRQHAARQRIGAGQLSSQSADHRAQRRWIAIVESVRSNVLALDDVIGGAWAMR
jgi:hypothetical protein